MSRPEGSGSGLGLGPPSADLLILALLWEPPEGLQPDKSAGLVGDERPSRSSRVRCGDLTSWIPDAAPPGILPPTKLRANQNAGIPAPITHSPDHL